LARASAAALATSNHEIYTTIQKPTTASVSALTDGSKDLIFGVIPEVDIIHQVKETGRGSRKLPGFKYYYHHPTSHDGLSTLWEQIMQPGKLRDSGIESWKGKYKRSECHEVRMLQAIDQEGRKGLKWTE